MLKIIREILLKIVNDIDTGNSNLSPEECEEVIEYLSGITNKNEKLSKYQACKYLKVSRATFDNYVKAKKIPNGLKIAKRFLCDDCRQKLVIEIKEIDKKD